MCAQLSTDFKRASQFVQQQAVDGKLSHLSNSTRLQLYALYKQGTSGRYADDEFARATDMDEQEERNSTWTGKLLSIVSSVIGPLNAQEAKQKAWQDLGDMDKEEAQRRYLDLVKNDLSIDPSSSSSSLAQQLAVDQQLSSFDTSPSNSAEKRAEDGQSDEKFSQDPEVNRLFQAVLAGDLAKVRELVNKDNVQVRDSCNTSLLHHAVDQGNLEIVKFLVGECGADINAEDSEGETPISYASICEFPEIEQYLLSMKNSE
ncbi:hypothetical protein MIR68_006382 [Amoeboaphelidium protococcarum]|nr:hypothetical protein MIR68_006382 [Amoeboaphelidium protococcarum]